MDFLKIILYNNFRNKAAMKVLKSKITRSRVDVSYDDDCSRKWYNILHYYL